MDGLRFDNLARAVAAGVPRRSVLKGLAAGIAVAALRFTGPHVANAQNTVPLGGQCSGLGANSECSQAGGSVVCSDNGVARDGQFNCCRNAGGACTADFHCCGGAVCANGSCGGGGGAGGRGLGAECTATSECSQSGGSVVCASNGVAADGARNCCRNTGGACTGDIQCCANLFCVNGTCGGTSTPETTPSGGLAPGAACTTTEQCSQSGGARVCGNNGYDGDGALNCCSNEGGVCVDATYSADCCGGLYCVSGVCTNNTTGGLALGASCTQTGQCSQATGAAVCASNGIDSDGTLNCCHNAGGACDRDIVCCGGLLCLNGACSSGEGSGGTIGLGGQCAATGECSQAGGAVFCDDNGIASDGALNCCRFEGGGCATGSQCCGGLDCTNGVCTPLGGGQGGGNIALGGECAADGECTASGGPSFCRNNGIDSDGPLNCCRFEGGTCSAGSHCCSGLLCTEGVCA